MVEELRRAVVRAGQQPEEEQRRIARLIYEVDDQAWEQSPALRAALAEAHAQFAAGDALDYEDYARRRRPLRPAPHGG